MDGLGPTLLGLGVVGLLFCIPLLLKIIRIFARPHSPRSGDGPDAPAHDDGFDADAVIVRYMARQSAEANPNISSMPARHEGGGRPGFGRKIR